MAAYDLAFLGFGNVGRALAALLAARRTALRERYGIEYRVTGVATRRGGWRADPAGLDAASTGGDRCADVREWLSRARPHVVFETLPLDVRAGLPALEYLREALAAGSHAVSANKGPLVHGYAELTRLAAANGVAYRFESAVMDGAPVFSLARLALPLAGLSGVRGVFTSTATLVLEAVERGLSVEAGIAEARRRGVAEADPSYDVDGWDSAMKLCALAVVLFGAALRPEDVARAGIASLDAVEVRRARREGSPYRLVGRLGRDDAAILTARVAPERVGEGDPLGTVRGTDLVLCYEAEVFPGGLVVTSRAPDLRTTAYGMMTDFLDVVALTRVGALR